MQIQSHSLQLASERNYNRSEEQQEQVRIARVSQDTVSGMRQVDTLVDVSQSERHEWLTYSASMGQNDRSDNVPAETRAQALAQTIPAEASATATATAAADGSDVPRIGRLEYQVGCVSPSENLHHLGPVDGTAPAIPNVVVGKVAKDQAVLLRCIAALSAHPGLAAANTGGDRKLLLGFYQFIGLFIG